MNRALRWHVLKEEQGYSLERILKEKLGLSRREISRLKFQEPGICLNGEKCRVNAVVMPGDEVELALESVEESRHQEPHPFPYAILYEDEDMLAVDKPSGVLVHPVGCHEEALSREVSRYLGAKGENTSPRSIGRLDKETSGLILFAKNQMAAARLWRQQEQGMFYKEYLAISRGTFQEDAGEIHLPLRKKEGARERMEVSLDGKEAITCYQVLASLDGGELLKLRLKTGRTHQIRVHMAYLSHPLLGDCLYGDGRAEKGERALLHAWRMEVCQPFTGEKLQIQAPLPGDFLERMRKDCQEYVFNDLMLY